MGQAGPNSSTRIKGDVSRVVRALSFRLEERFLDYRITEAFMLEKPSKSIQSKL